MSSNPMSDRHKAWLWAKKNPEFTVKDLAVIYGKSVGTTRKFILRLIELKRVKKIQNGRGNHPGIYKVISCKDIQFGSGRNPCPLRPNAKQKRCWTSMRVLRAFSIGDIACGAEVPYTTAQHFVNKLRQAGYIVCIQGARHDVAGIGAKFRLIHNSGPLPPKLKKDGLVDRNTDKYHPYQMLNNTKQEEIVHEQGKQKLA